MANIIPVPVVVSVGVPVGSSERRPARNFGAFRLVPYATTRGGSLNILRWLLMAPDGVEELEEVSLFTVMPRKLLFHVCQQTFECERDSIPVIFTIDDQKWSYSMCARELEYEQVHYMIEIEGEWIKLTELSLNEIIGEEQLVFAEREVLPSIDFADPEQVFEKMG